MQQHLFDAGEISPPDSVVPSIFRQEEKEQENQAVDGVGPHEGEVPAQRAREPSPDAESFREALEENSVVGAQVDGARVGLCLRSPQRFVDGFGVGPVRPEGGVCPPYLKPARHHQKQEGDVQPVGDPQERRVGIGGDDRGALRRFLGFHHFSASSFMIIASVRSWLPSPIVLKRTTPFLSIRYFVGQKRF